MNEYQKAGEQNGWLSKYVVEAKNEIETLDSEINEIKEEMKTLKVSPDAQNENIEQPVGGNRE